MLARTIVLTAIVAAAVSAAVTLALATLPFAAASRAAPEPPSQPPAQPQAQAPSQPQVVRATRFELVDADGTVLAHLGRTAEGDVSLMFEQRGGAGRAVVGLSAAGVPAVVILDPQGAVAALGGGTVAGGASSGGAGLLVQGANGQGGIGAVMLPDGRPLWQITDANGQPRTVIGLGGDGAATITINDANGGVIWQVP
jgi:hypothetical protein